MRFEVLQKSNMDNRKYVLLEFSWRHSLVYFCHAPESVKYIARN